MGCSCLQLLKDFPPAEGETKPMTFKRVLLNTCQEEFEGTAEARQGLKNLPAEEREVCFLACHDMDVLDFRLVVQVTLFCGTRSRKDGGIGVGTLL